MNNNILGDKHATLQKPMTLQVQVTVCPWVWNSKTVPVPVEHVTVTPQSYLYPCYTLLLKPWTNLAELKSDTKTFEQAFNLFVSDAPKWTLNIIENIQYYYQCYDSAKR